MQFSTLLCVSNRITLINISIRRNSTHNLLVIQITNCNNHQKRELQRLQHNQVLKLSSTAGCRLIIKAGSCQLQMNRRSVVTDANCVIVIEILKKDSLICTALSRWYNVPLRIPCGNEVYTIIIHYISSD